MLGFFSFVAHDEHKCLPLIFRSESATPRTVAAQDSHFVLIPKFIVLRVFDVSQLKVEASDGWPRPDLTVSHSVSHPPLSSSQIVPSGSVEQCNRYCDYEHAKSRGFNPNVLTHQDHDNATQRQRPED